MCMKRVIGGVVLSIVLFCVPFGTSAKDRPIKSCVIELNIDEAQELMQIAFAEGGNQGEDGQWLIMSVILNRVNSPDFPDSVHDVIYEPGQFYTKGMKAATPTADTHLALARIERGEVAPQIVAFESEKCDVLEKYFSYAFTFRDHKFLSRKEDAVCSR